MRLGFRASKHPTPHPPLPGMSNPVQPERPTPTRPRRLLRKAAEWVAWILGALILVQLVGWWRAPDLPDAAPGFELRTLDGETVALEDFRGRTVVLNFWAAWCMPCRAEVPAFSRFARNNPEVVVLGIAADGSPAELREAAEKLGMEYPVLVADAATKQAYGVTTLPTTVVVGPEGDVRYAHSGIMLDPQIAFAVRQ